MCIKFDPKNQKFIRGLHIDVRLKIKFVFLNREVKIHI